MTLNLLNNIPNLLGLPIIPPIFPIKEEFGYKSELLTRYGYMTHLPGLKWYGQVYPAGPKWKRIPRKLKKKWKEKYGKIIHNHFNI